MVARTGFSATTSRKSRQARKGAAVAAMSGAGGELVRAASFHELRSGLTGFGNPVRIAARSAVKSGFVAGGCAPRAKSVVFAACPFA